MEFRHLDVLGQSVVFLVQVQMRAAKDDDYAKRKLGKYFFDSPSIGNFS